MMMVLLLVGFWSLAWGEFSVVNLISGVLVAGLLLVAFPRDASDSPRFRIDAAGLTRLVIHILRQLVVSTPLVARQVISRRSRVRSGVIAHRMQDGSPAVISTLANAIALTPGTMTVEATIEPAVVYVHFLLLDDIEEARRDIAHLERLVIAALGKAKVTQTGDAG